MNEQDLVKALVDSGLMAVMIAYIMRLDNQRITESAARSAREKEMSDARAEDNNRWLAIYARGGAAAVPFSSKSPTSLEP